MFVHELDVRQSPAGYLVHELCLFEHELTQNEENDKSRYIMSKKGRIDGEGALSYLDIKDLNTIV